ncbi:DNA methyltransferase [Niallia sp. Man26]|uniref:DNA methyltransferase n=1 Tax=Niallia sp. Man26 TaxID=2912824 RepID=UPI001EDBF2EF|nr:DNA methyltransferase [Niallia sp. Man26]UPO91082.1 N-6 DNA methylase [Niallia sp. Man26]
MSKKYLLSITEIEDRVKTIIKNLNEETFIEEFLGLFDIPKTSITRAKSSEGDFLIRNKVLYRKVQNNPILAIDKIEQKIVSQNQKPRYIITTDFEMLYAKDTKTNDSLAIHFEDLPTYSEFFLAWNGIEKVDYLKENPADIKAAERFTKLYDELVKINPELAKKEADGKPFNLFLIRSLFLYFCEDTEIITKGSFTNVLKTRTKTNGSNLNSIIKELFSILDVPENQRQDVPEWLKKFPYVNGKLFKEPHHELNFSTLTRKLLIEAGELLNWNEINPDILGAMIQTVANKEERQVSGMHYTSVSNIMKVIKPLFLDNLRTEYQRLSDLADDYLEREITEEHRRKQQRSIINQFENLLERMSKIKFLDPACGSGNFLIIAYKEIRRLEIDCLIKIREVRKSLDEKDVYQGSLLKQSKIKLNQFSGIELDDFAHEVARLSLYIAEHQMNLEMTAALADYQPRILPLQESGNIVHANALRVDWNEVVIHESNDEIYIMGNPPYIAAKGTNHRTESQTQDLLFAIYPNNFRIVDYIFGWFFKASKLIQNKTAKYAFVTTNSLFQGIQAIKVQEHILTNLEISFAYPTIKWNNNAKNNAGVIVSIVGISNIDSNMKKLYTDDDFKEVDSINAYLGTGEGIRVSKSRELNPSLPYQMELGSAGYEGNNLIFSKSEYENIIADYPNSAFLFKKFLNAKDLVNDNYSYVVWINDNQLEEAEKIPELTRRFELVKKFRQEAGTTAKSSVSTYWKFSQIRYKNLPAIVIPVINSEKRDYICGTYSDTDTVFSNQLYLIYDAPIWLLGVLESRMHMTWFRAVGGRLKMDYRYSAGLVFNTFPIPDFSTNRKNILEEAVLEMLDVREEEGGTLAELYGGANKPMNARLREAHEKIDGIVERAYKQEPFKSDEERLNLMLKLYQEKVSKEKK